tara:strand:- start:31049 stop:31633 length:585 start_codon:yes stop_codon:yes gene_type:complete
MAQTVINLSDPINTWVTKSNDMAADIGDLATLSDSAATLVHAINSIDSDIGARTSLTTSVKTSLVDAINSIGTDFLEQTDSASVKAFFASSTTISLDSGTPVGARAQFSLVDSSVVAGKLASGIISTEKIVDDAITLAKMANNSVSTSELVDSSITEAKIQINTITSASFKSATSLLIKNTAGTTLKTMFGPGE